MNHSRRDLVERYLRTCWIIKLRLMSARRQLWDHQGCSLIHLENSCLQIRKSCEGIAQLCLVAAHVEHDTIPAKIRKKYEVGRIFKYLKSIRKFKFISRARMLPLKNEKNSKKWLLKKEEPDENDVNRVIKIFNRCGNVLHENSAFGPFPSDLDEAVATIAHNRNAIRADHQWLWNFLWQHAILLTDSPVFFIDFHSDDDTCAPGVVQYKGFLDEDVEFDFHPDYIADFSGPIDWNEYKD